MSRLDSHIMERPLRVVTCGSVGDGKTTLVGRLLRASERRSFIVADTPLHEQDTGDLVTGATTADLAIILVDARKGVQTQTRRHSFLVSLLGIDRIVLAVNKLDLVGYQRDVFAAVEQDFRTFAARIDLTDIASIPISALVGDNVTERSDRTDWYAGPTLSAHLESVDVGDGVAGGPFRMLVARTDHPDPDRGGVRGTVVGGTLRPGDTVRALPSGRTSTVVRISTSDGETPQATTGESVTVVLTDEIDVSRDDVLCAGEDPAGIADQFGADVVWMHDHHLLPGRPYLMERASRTVGVTLSAPKYKVNVDSLEHVAAKTLERDEIGVSELATDRPIAFDPYTANRELGGFVIVDRLTNETVGAGMLRFALRRAHNVHWQAIDVTAEARRDLMGHGSAVVWFTGLSGAGKSTIANRTEQRLHVLGVHTCLLDGDNVRHGLNRDLGFTEVDRVENIRRVAEVARLMADAGLVVLVSFISPFEAERQLARDLAGKGRFCEVYVDTPIEVAEARDPKGLYRKARRGELVNFTGIDSPYEPPTSPDVHLTERTSPEDAAESILGTLRSMGVVGS